MSSSLDGLSGYLLAADEVGPDAVQKVEVTDATPDNPDYKVDITMTGYDRVESLIKRAELNRALRRMDLL